MFEDLVRYDSIIALDFSFCTAPTPPPAAVEAEAAVVGPVDFTNFRKCLYFGISSYHCLTFAPAMLKMRPSGGIMFLQM